MFKFYKIYLTIILTIFIPFSTVANENVAKDCPVGFATISLLKTRDRLAQMAGVYQRSGMGSEYMKATMAIEELDEEIYSAYLNQWIQNIELTGDPSCAVNIFNQRSGVKIGVIGSPNSWDIVVKGRVTKSGLRTNELKQILLNP